MHDSENIITEIINEYEFDENSKLAPEKRIATVKSVKFVKRSVVFAM